MNADEKRIWGESCRRLQNDPDLQKVLATVRDEQIKVLEKYDATPEQLTLAHGIACGVKRILAEISRGVNNAEISERKS